MPIKKSSKFSLALLFISVTTLLQGPAFAEKRKYDFSWVEPKQKAIQKIVDKSGINAKEIGMYIAISDSTDQQIFKLNEQKLYIPASLSKLATTTAVLESFPPGTTFKTQILTTAEQKGSQLQGDLYLRGGGDSGFVSESMWYLVNVFTRNQILEVTGDIIVDDTLFDSVRFDPTRPDINVDRAYDAPVGAMSFNWNSVNVFVRPGNKVGDPAKVFIDPDNGFVKLKGSITTVSGASDIQISRDENQLDDTDTISVGGKVSIKDGESVTYKSITKPDLWSGYNLKTFLKDRGIVVRGKVIIGKTPQDAKVLAQTDSKPIEGLLNDMNKFSNNYVSEMLTKSIASLSQSQATLGKGVENIKATLNRIGLENSEFTIINPSGISRKNQITPHALWKIITYLQNQFNEQPELFMSLPIAGVDGTLKKRMKGTNGERWVRAKTGTMDGIVGLAGYAGRRDGMVIPFAMIYNGGVDAAKVRQLFDQIAVELATTN